MPSHFTPRKESPLRTDQEAGWAPDTAWTFWGENNLFPLPSIKSQITPSVAQSLYWLNYPSSKLAGVNMAVCPLLWLLVILSSLLMWCVCQLVPKTERIFNFPMSIAEIACIGSLCTFTNMYSSRAFPNHCCLFTTHPTINVTFFQFMSYDRTLKAYQHNFVTQFHILQLLSPYHQ